MFKEKFLCMPDHEIYWFKWSWKVESRVLERGMSHHKLRRCLHSWKAQNDGKYIYRHDGLSKHDYSTLHSQKKESGPE